MCVAQARKVGASGIEQAGKGGKRKPGRFSTGTPNAPPLMFACTH